MMHRFIWRQPTSCMVLLRFPLACNLALARPRKAATGKILQMRTIDALCEKFGERRMYDALPVDGGQRLSQW